MVFKAVVKEKNRKGESQHNARFKEKKILYKYKNLYSFSAEIKCAIGNIISMSEVNKKGTR